MKPKLYIFAISHFCEKARWALEYLEIDHDVVHLAPALHSKLASKLGLDSSSLPILEFNDKVIQGSDNIIDWAEQISDQSLAVKEDVQKARDLEISLGEVLGVHTRRMFYSEALIEHSATVRPIFTKDLPLLPKAFTWLMWPVIRQKMIARMDLGEAQGLESRDILDREITCLETMIKGPGTFLVGNSFSRLDLTAASLLARMAAPPDHPSFKYMARPPRIKELAEQWYERPAMVWVRWLYSEYR